MRPVDRLLLLLCAFLLIGCNPPAPKQLPPATRPHLIVVTQPATTRSVDAEPTTTDPRDTLPFLASDGLAGRLPGSPGIQRAGDFLAGEVARIGLKPAPGQADYFQPFEMAQTSTIASSTQLSINDQPELLGKDFAPMALSAQATFHAPVVFIGFGISTELTEDARYDDYTGIDVRGKVVLAMMKEPLSEKNVSRLAGPGQVWSNHALFVEKARLAAKHGAVALLLVAPPSSGGVDTVNPYSGDGQHAASIPVFQITRRLANVMLSMGGQGDLKSVQDQIDQSGLPHSVLLKDINAAGTVVIEHTHITVRNVIAALPGKGPQANEWVIVGAHYDHLGRGQMGHMAGGSTGAIWHGADDNASGTAALIELADQLRQGPPLPRSVLFIFFTAEEEGLVGSDYFVHHPTIPLENAVAMLNLDMVGRLKDNSLLVGGAATAPMFDAMVQSAIRGTPLITSVALPDEGGRGGMGPSDHMSFALHKIPVLFLFTGMHADYHRPTDTADKINYEGIDTVVGVSQRIVAAMAAMPRQAYDARSDNAALARMFGGSPHQVVLGVVPSDNAIEVTTGVPISTVVKDGPADRAGIKANDLLTAFNGKPVHNLSDLSEALDEAHAGDRVVLRVLRGSQAVDLHAVLEAK
jgi:mannose/fructose-specific phosphotransferase system component IIA